MPLELFKINICWKKDPVYTKRAPIISQTLRRGILGVVGVVGSSAAFYWLINTHELERPSDLLISSCGAGGSRGVAASSNSSAKRMSQLR